MATTVPRACPLPTSPKTVYWFITGDNWPGLEESTAMDGAEVTIELPAEVHAELEALAEEEHTTPAGVIQRLVTVASRQRAWLRDLASLREQIERDGGLQIGTTSEEVVARLRQTRREIFRAEYAHLYR
jgi:hypothetical protein